MVPNRTGRGEVFLIHRRRGLRKERYEVLSGEDAGTPLFFFVRSRHFLPNLLAAAAGSIVLLLIFMLSLALAAKGRVNDLVAVLFIMAGALAGGAAFILVVLSLSPPRTFRMRDGKGDLVLMVRERRRIRILSSTFSVLDGAGEALAFFRLDFYSGLFARRWSCFLPSGERSCEVVEGPSGRGLAWRIPGILGLQRRDLIFLDPGGGLRGRFIRPRSLPYRLELPDTPSPGPGKRIFIALALVADALEGR